tara:strand:+ start:4276 stop:4455 length:180 start_codon:yes stop_codon:yes gene_type:complete
MSGAKYRPRNVGLKGGDVRYYNILFPVSIISRIKRRAESMKITGAELVRKAVVKFLEEK